MSHDTTELEEECSSGSDEDVIAARLKQIFVPTGEFIVQEAEMSAKAAKAKAEEALKQPGVLYKEDEPLPEVFRNKVWRALESRLDGELQFKKASKRKASAPINPSAEQDALGIHCEQSDDDGGGVKLFRKSKRSKAFREAPLENSPAPAINVPTLRWTAIRGIDRIDEDQARSMAVDEEYIQREARASAKAALQNIAEVDAQPQSDDTPSTSGRIAQTAMLQRACHKPKPEKKKKEKGSKSKGHELGSEDVNGAAEGVSLGGLEPCIGVGKAERKKAKAEARGAVENQGSGLSKQEKRKMNKAMRKARLKSSEGVAPDV